VVVPELNSPKRAKRVIHLIAAARPNFMKIAPLYHALRAAEWARPVLVHTGQHYDLNMSDVFFQELQLPAPDLHLGVGSGSHAAQTGQVMMAYETILRESGPDLVVVVGDVNSTAAATLAAAKLGIPVAHLEAGLRSFDRTMPEEINRLVTDVLADRLWTPSPDADDNLRREGISAEKIVRVGNIMIDSLEMMRSRIDAAPVYPEWGLSAGGYGLLTLHRPGNVDDPKTLAALCDRILTIAERIPLLFPVHPRTRKNLRETGLWDRLAETEALRLTEPLSYVRFMNLVFNCRFVLTDSGGVQEETTYLGIPCLTLRPNTERPVTVTDGTNRLCTLDGLLDDVDAALSGRDDARPSIPLWDGNAAGRVVSSIQAFFEAQ
jgi:UDP-N-acetylglucosamine 2-epimerase (non-hydrolysing)